MGRIESADLKTDYERALVGMALIEGIQTSLWGKESNGAFSFLVALFRSAPRRQGKLRRAQRRALDRCGPLRTSSLYGRKAGNRNLSFTHQLGALPSACSSTLKKVLDTAGIVREAI
jgi:hypothetical protein